MSWLALGWKIGRVKGRQQQKGSHAMSATDRIPLLKLWGSTVSDVHQMYRTANKAWQPPEHQWRPDGNGTADHYCDAPHCYSPGFC
jgi:hypothetical protein